MTRRSEIGFSAIEALVALAIVAIALLPLLSLQSQVTRGFGRQREVREAAAAQHNSLALLRDLNVMETPTGELRLDQRATMRWNAHPISRLVTTTRQGTGEGDFIVALYRVDVSVTGAGRPVYQFSVDQVGWRAVDAGR